MSLRMEKFGTRKQIKTSPIQSAHVETVLHACGFNAHNQINVQSEDDVFRFLQLSDECFDVGGADVLFIGWSETVC